ncbi:hypothetical protein QBC39DRAFT_437115 [Podospora conica]|nr:hypothetical protein QBC39DRAFT_437115 [Schizothecium conicum]
MDWWSQRTLKQTRDDKKNRDKGAWSDDRMPTRRPLWGNTFEVTVNNWVILWLVANLAMDQVTIGQVPHISTEANVLSPIAFNVNATRADSTTQLGERYRSRLLMACWRDAPKATSSSIFRMTVVYISCFTRSSISKKTMRLPGKMASTMTSTFFGPKWMGGCAQRIIDIAVKGSAIARPGERVRCVVIAVTRGNFNSVDWPQSCLVQPGGASDPEADQDDKDRTSIPRSVKTACVAMAVRGPKPFSGRDQGLFPPLPGRPIGSTLRSENFQLFIFHEQHRKVALAKKYKLDLTT